MLPKEMANTVCKNKTVGRNFRLGWTIISLAPKIIYHKISGTDLIFYLDKEKVKILGRITYNLIING